MLPTPERAAGAWFQLLGGLRVLDGGGREVPVGPPKRQLVLAALLVDAGRLVTADTLIDRAWGDAPPPRVAGVLRAHLSHIRGRLDDLRPPDPGPVLVRRAGGYVLDVDPDRVDVHRFRRLAAAAAAADGDDQRAALLTRARALWAGEPLAGLPGRWAEETAELLRREHLAGTVDWAETQLRRGQPGLVVDALEQLAVRHRLDEAIGAAHLKALAASGRPARALAEYGRIRDHLVAELGSEPGPELQAVHRELLGADRPAAAGPEPPAVGRVAELPPPAQPFCGRDADLDALDAAGAGPAPVVVLSGAGGVGKTALAVHWARARRAAFPDGQLYVDLRGLDADPVPATRVLERVLRTLGVPAADIPADEDGRAALYRSRLAERRLLVLLDNAGSSAQVRPLLPGSPGCLTLVTSRRGLDGLVARDGARRHPVGELDPGSSVQLLTAMLHGARPDPAGPLLRRLADLCGGLPLALRIAAARLLADPARPVAALVAELAGRHRLSGLDLEQGDVAVRGAFDLSYRRLPEPAARAFRLLGLVPATGHGLGAPAVAALLDVAEPAARETLRVLADAHLATPRPDGRHDLHDLVHLYAQERVAADEDAAAAGAALDGLLGWYVRRCDAADRLLSRGRPFLPRPAAARGRPEWFADQAAALAWFHDEAATLRALVRLAADRGCHDTVWQLAESQVEVLKREHRADDLLAVSDLAVAAARAAGQPSAEALFTNAGGVAHVLGGRLDDAVARMQRAAELHLRNGDLGRAGLARMNVGSARSDQGDLERALPEYLAAIELLERADHQAGVAICACNLGELHRRRGEHAEAERSLRRAIELTRALGSERDLGIALEDLAEVLAATGRVDEAFAGFEEALAVARAAGDRLTEGRALAGRGDLLSSLGRTGGADGADTAWRAALAVLTAIGSPEAAVVRTRLAALPR